MMPELALNACVTFAMKFLIKCVQNAVWFMIARLTRQSYFDRDFLDNSACPSKSLSLLWADLAPCHGVTFLFVYCW